MTFQINGLIGFGAAAAGVAATISFTASTVQVATATTYTFLSQSFGTADPTRNILAAVTNERSGGSNATVSSLSIGGIAASLVAGAQVAGADGCELWVAPVPTGTSGTVALTLANAALSVGVGLFATYNASATRTDVGTDTDSNPATFAIDIPAGGVAVAIGLQRSNSGATFTSSGLTENYDETVEAGDIYHTGASAAFAAAQTNLTISITSSDASVRAPVMVTASFPSL